MNGICVTHQNDKAGQLAVKASLGELPSRNLSKLSVFKFGRTRTKHLPLGLFRDGCANAFIRASYASVDNKTGRRSLSPAAIRSDTAKSVYRDLSNQHFAHFKLAASNRFLSLS